MASCSKVEQGHAQPFHRRDLVNKRHLEQQRLEQLVLVAGNPAYPSSTKI